MPAACDNEVVVRNTFLHVIEHADDVHYESDEESEIAPGFAVPRSITAPSLGVNGDSEGCKSGESSPTAAAGGASSGVRGRSLSESLEKDRAAAVAAAGRVSKLSKARSEPPSSDAEQQEEDEEEEEEDEQQQQLQQEELESGNGQGEEEKEEVKGTQTTHTSAMQSDRQVEERDSKEKPSIMGVEQDVSGWSDVDKTPGQAKTKKMSSKERVDFGAEAKAEGEEDSTSEAGSDWWADVAKPRFDQQFMRHRTFDPFDGPHESVDIELPNLVHLTFGEHPMAPASPGVDMEQGAGVPTFADGSRSSASGLNSNFNLSSNLNLALPAAADQALEDGEEKNLELVEEEEEPITMPVSTPSPTNFPLLRGSKDPFSLEEPRELPLQDQPQGSSPQQPGFPSGFILGGNGFCTASPLTPASPAPRNNCAMTPTPTPTAATPTTSAPCTWCVTVPCPSPSYQNSSQTPTMSPIVTSTFTPTATSPFNVQMPSLGTQDGQRACDRQPMHTPPSVVHQVSPSSPDGVNRPATFAFFTPFNSNMNSSHSNGSAQQMCSSNSGHNTMNIGNNCGNINNSTANTSQGTSNFANTRSNTNTNANTNTNNESGARDVKLERCLFDGRQGGSPLPAAIRAIPTPMRQTKGLSSNSNTAGNNMSSINAGGSPGNGQQQHPQQQQQPQPQPPQLPNFSSHHQHRQHFQGASPAGAASMSLASMVTTTTQTPTATPHAGSANSPNMTPTMSNMAMTMSTTPMGRRSSHAGSGSSSTGNSNAQPWPAPVGEGEVDGPCTTVMLKNLPNNYTRNMLLELIDACGFSGDYDFLYMPIDFRTRAAMGYAFVNMVTKEAAQRLFQCLDGFSDWSLPSSKVCNVAWSDPRQGIDSHIARYRNSPLMHAVVPDEYRPALFANGRRIQFPPPTKRVKAPRQGTERMLV